jgi:DNA-binding NtrC family response regulator
VNEIRHELEEWRDTLERAGYTVSACTSYREGVISLTEERFDFAVVHQGGPTFPGRAVLEATKGMEPRPPVLVLARCAEMSCYLEAMQLGALDYFETPLAASKLLELVNKYLVAQEFPMRLAAAAA